MPGKTVTIYPNELYHHGILGQKWGVRRFQNPDGTRTEAGKKRERTSNPKTKKELSKGQKTAIVVGAAAVLGGAAYYAANRTKVNSLIKRMASQTISDIKSLSGPDKYTNPRMVDLRVRGQKFMQDKIYTLPKRATKGIKDGLGEGYDKASKAVGIGISMLAAKEVLDIVAGKQRSEQIFKANNKKKIDSFWKVYNDVANNNKKKDDDDDD